MTPTVERVTLSPLGDCLLHLDHHELEPACWNLAISYYLAAQRRGLTDAQAKDLYKRDYEGRLTLALMKEHMP